MTRTGAKAIGRDGRRAQRLGVRLNAGLRETGFPKFPADVIDMSVTGFRFKTSYNLHIGTRIWLNLPGLESREASIMWRDGFTYGCAFQQPLHSAVLDHIIAKHSSL